MQQWLFRQRVFPVFCWTEVPDFARLPQQNWALSDQRWTSENESRRWWRRYGDGITGGR